MAKAVPSHGGHNLQTVPLATSFSGVYYRAAAGHVVVYLSAIDYLLKASTNNLYGTSILLVNNSVSGK